MAGVSAQEIADDLRRAIQSGELTPGALVPSERELVTHYKASKNTVAKALLTLRAEGLLISQIGRGVFVRYFKRHLRSRRPAGTSPTETETKAQNIERELRLLSVETVPAPADIAARLNVTEGTPLVVRRHLITLDGDPAQAADSFFVASQVAGSQIARTEEIAGGVHAELAVVLGEALTRATEESIARMPTPTERETLALLPGTPVVELVCTIYAGDRPVEVTVWLFDAGRHRFLYDVPVD